MTKKTEGLRDTASEELQDRLINLRADLARERALIASGTRPEKPSKIRNMRRTIARIFTIINEKKLKLKQAGNKNDGKKKDGTKKQGGKKSVGGNKDKTRKQGKKNNGKKDGKMLEKTGKKRG